ncbi:MAG: phage major capsid protein [Eubacteriales bacterium]
MANIPFAFGSHVADSVFGYSQAPIRKIIEERAEAQEKLSILPYLFNIEKTEKPIEKLTSLTAMEGFEPVGENGAYPNDGLKEGYSKIIEQMTWKDQFVITQEAVEDAVAIDLRKKPSQFTVAYYRTRERFGAAMYGNAIKLADSFSIGNMSFSCQTADGVDLFSTAHPSKVSGANQSNYFADSFSADALAAAETAMQNFRGDNDNIMTVAPNTILIPNNYSLKKAVFAAVGSDKDPDTANNGFNFLFARWRVIVWAELNRYITAGTNPWVLLDSAYNEEYDGAPWLDRIPLSVRSTVDEGTDANVWKGRARFNAAFHDWRFAAVGGVANGSALL